MVNENPGQHARLLELTHDAVFAWRLESGVITYWNDRACNLYGYSVEEAVGADVRTLLNTVFPADISVVQEAVHRDGYWKGLLQHTAKDGSQIQADTRMVCDSAPRDQQVVLQTTQDVTVRVKAEQALRVSEERFRSFVMATAQIAVIANSDGQVVEDSPSWRSVTGQSFAEFQASGWTAIHPEDRPTAQNRWARSVVSAQPFEAEYRLQHADGQFRWVSMRAVPIRNPDGSVREWVGAIADIHDKKLAESGSIISQERLHYALEAGSMVTWDWNVSTGYTRRTGPTEALFGIGDGPQEEFFALVHPADSRRLTHAIEHALRHDTPFECEYRIKRPDGRLNWVSSKARLRVDPTDGQRYMTGVAMDITKRRQARDRLKLLDDMTEATRTFTQPEAIIGQATALLGEHLGATRCAYAEFEPGSDHFTIRYDWTLDGARSAAGTYSLDLLGVQAVADMRAGRTLVVRDADTELAPGCGLELFEAVGIKSAICCRLLKGEHMIGMIAVHQETARDWAVEDVALVEEIAERFWAHMERVRARDALQKSEAHLSSLLEQTAVGISELDTSGRIVRVNDKYCQILKRSEEEIVGHYMQEFTHPGDLPRNILKLEQTVETGEPFEIEKRYLAPDGSSIWVSTTVSLIRESGEEPAGSLMTVVQDITERKKAEQKLVETAGRLQLTLDAAEIGDWELNLITDEAQRSPRHDLCFGYSEPLEDWGFEKFISHVHPDDRGYVTDEFRVAVDETHDWHFECRVIWPDESVHWIAAHGRVQLVDGEPSKMGGIVFDITDRKMHEQALRESEQRALAAASQAEAERHRLDAVLEAVPVGIAVSTADGILDQVNRAHRQFWGTNSPNPGAQTEEMGWKGWWADGSKRHGQRLAPQDWTAMRALRGEEGPHDIIEIESFDEPPVRRVIIVSAALIRDNSGGIAGVAAAQMDITDRIKAEEALREADRRKDEFLAMLAHELRNPLAPIGAAADILRLGNLDENRVTQASAIISRQVAHMTGLVDDLLDVSRVTRGLVALDKVKLDAKKIIADAVEQVRPLIEARGHKLTVHTPPDAAFVLADQKRLVQVMTNLLNNSAKYTPEGGDIVLRVEVDGDFVKLTVADNGIGMEPVLVERVFELFTQAERSSDRTQGGLGIGLALVRSLIELHGGTVQAQSEGPGCGSTFTVCLPQLRQPGGGESPSVITENLAAPGCALKILVVDDNVDAAQMLALFCEALGHSTMVEYGSKTALTLAQRELPDVCLLDIGLPDMDGNELARRLKSHTETSRAVLVAVTGYGQEQDKKTAFEAGFDHHFVKPLDTKKLAELLRAIAGEKK